MDLRLLPVAAAAWLAAVVVVRIDAQPALAAAAVIVALGIGGLAAARGCRRLRLQARPAIAGATLPLVAAGLVTLSAALMLTDRTDPAWREAVRGEASVTMTVTAATDPRPAGTADRFTGGKRYILEARVRQFTFDGKLTNLDTPVMIIGGPGWSEVVMGDSFRTSGKLQVAEPGDRSAGVLFARTPPSNIVPADGLLSLSADLRQRLVESTPDGLPLARSLLPGMLVGDRSQLTPELETAMKNTGLTHLTAVSGANCAYVLGFAFLVGRGLRFPRWAAAILAVGSLAAFVVLVRPDPSVLRAAVMGCIGVLALVSGRGRMSLPMLALAVVLLLVVDPWLSGSYAFILSVLATSGLVLIGQPCAAWLGQWMPTWAAGALAVPLAAQAFCAPVLILLQPAVTTYSLPANVLAAPAVPIVTILGMLAVAVLVWLPGLAELILFVAGLAAEAVGLTAMTFAALPGATLPWPDGFGGAALMALASGLCIVGLWYLAGRSMRREYLPGENRHSQNPLPAVRNMAAALRMQLADRPGFPWPVLVAVGIIIGLIPVVLLRFVRGEAPPPPDWDIAACDVGQGDAFAVRTGPEEAMLIDAGPEPGATDACLKDLGITKLSTVVLSHLHADHSDGIPGALRDRPARRMIYSTIRPEAQRTLSSAAGQAGTEAVRAYAGMNGTDGNVSWRVLWPEQGRTPATENDASIVLEVLISQHGSPPLRALFTGDLEEEAAARLLARYPELRAGTVSVLKVAHHGARNGGEEIIRRLRPRLALVSVGADNDYGHPAPEIVRVLEETGTRTVRTDVNGTVLVDLAGRRLDLFSRPG